MPFTQAEFFAVFARYNEAVWPLAVVAALLGIAVLAALARPSRGATHVVTLALAAMWAVNGALYHAAFFVPINPAAWGFAVLFIVQAGLLAAAPFVWPQLRFTAGSDARTVVAFALIVFAVAVYPAWGHAAGHVYPAVPLFGIAPCPTTIFSIGILLLGQWRMVRWLLLLPAIWAAIGGSAALLLDVPQDLGLFAALAAIFFVGVRGGRNEKGGWR